MSEEKFSPLPWRWRETGGSEKCYYREGCNAVIESTEHELAWLMHESKEFDLANAAFIVEAVNAYHASALRIAALELGIARAIELIDHDDQRATREGRDVLIRVLDGKDI